MNKLLKNLCLLFLRRTPGILLVAACTFLLSCGRGKNNAEIGNEIKALNLERGEITLCGSGTDQFGKVSFGLACSEEVRTDFNLATALLHSFEYMEAEKVFARIMEREPQCLMAYWGAAMCNFHPLWEPPSRSDLEKGSKVIALARSIKGEQSERRERDYLDAIGMIYDQWETLDHRTRLIKYEKAMEDVFQKHPEDSEAAVFYALALRAAADPADKSYSKQRKAGAILEQLFRENPNHPGVIHYIIHTYDYPELAEQALAAARSYASVAAASAHAQHMPSHIFTRLGLWSESIQSNLNSISSAQCYAEKTGIKGHWDEELHGMDYLVYAYLQRGDDESAQGQLSNLRDIREVHPANFKVAYSVAAMPARFALERKDWQAAASLELTSMNVPWEKCPWEKANYHFARLMGAVHLKQLDKASAELDSINEAYKKLKKAGDEYKSNLVLIQVKASEGWIKLAEGKRPEAITSMTEAVDLEERTEKHPVTPGELIPARELLGDMYMESGQYDKALEAYKASLLRHPNRFTGVYGAALAAEKLKQSELASSYYNQLLSIVVPSCIRPEVLRARGYLRM